MYPLYHALTSRSEFVLEALLKRRLKKGKEDAARLTEKKGIPSLNRPSGKIIWIHAASVGEVQSTLILVNRLLALFPDIHILVTSGTVNSAKLMAQKLPERTIHQFYPLDHPNWTYRFLEHWQPELILWMESELWPNMLMQIKARKIPALLLNARISSRSFNRWSYFKSLAMEILCCFSKILCQTENDVDRFIQLGAPHAIATGNLKFSAAPLAFEKSDWQMLNALTTGRPIWLFASTHKGEEEMACRLHRAIKTVLPELLTIIVPRHPERREEILKSSANYGLRITLRGSEKKLPQPDDDIYIADTLGELGIFYRLAPIACVGRSFSDDGGGGHNPIEPAQLGCVVLHGPNVQNLQEVYDLMDSANASIPLKDEGHFQTVLQMLLTDADQRQTLQNKALTFTRKNQSVADMVMKEIIESFQSTGYVQNRTNKNYNAESIKNNAH